MSENERTFPALRLHPWRYLPILIILGLVVHLLVPQIAALEKSWAVIQAMTWWVVILAIVAQVLSYIGSGYMLHTIMAINQQKLSTLKGILITMAANSIGLVAGVGLAAMPRHSVGFGRKPMMETTRHWPAPCPPC